MDKGAKQLCSYGEIISMGFKFLICATDVHIRAIKYFPILTFYESRREETIPLVPTSQCLLPFKMLLLFFLLLVWYHDRSEHQYDMASAITVKSNVPNEYSSQRTGRFMRLPE